MTTILQTINGRLRHPLIGAFTIAFIAVNWKPIAILLFSSFNIETKIIQIDHSYSDNWHLYWLPLLIAISYSIILPYLSLLITAIIKWATKNRNVSLYNERIEELEKEEHIAKLKKRIADAEAGTSEISKLSAELRLSKGQLQDAENNVEALAKSNNELEKLNKELKSNLSQHVNIFDEIDEDLAIEYYSNYLKTMENYRNTDLFIILKRIVHQGYLSDHQIDSSNDIINKLTTFDLIYEKEEKSTYPIEATDIYYYPTQKGLFFTYCSEHQSIAASTYGHRSGQFPSA